MYVRPQRGGRSLAPTSAPTPAPTPGTAITSTSMVATTGSSTEPVMDAPEGIAKAQDQLDQLVELSGLAGPAFSITVQLFLLAVSVAAH